MSASRNRELLALVPVALLSDRGLRRGLRAERQPADQSEPLLRALLLAICLATHIYIRIRLPNADLPTSSR